MAEIELVGLQEIASLASVTPSAVANWRKRFDDFPAPVVELKSGPVFREPQIRGWLAKRQGKDLKSATQFYEQLAGRRGDDAGLSSAVDEAVEKLSDVTTTAGKPGVLLGKIQGGKTRAYLGIIARAFDRGYDVAVILTKGTKSLARQTLSRVKNDFSEFIESDLIQVYDIMSVPDLTPYELQQKLVFVVKKEDDNLRHLLTAFEQTYPVLREKRVLIVDDEADLASVTFRRQEGTVQPGKISAKIDRLRELVASSSFLQVTATPYALYLQPEDDVVVNGSLLFKPKRPQFTVVLPTHGDYVGGDQYFEKNTDSQSPAYYFYREVPVDEREALRREDRRRLKIENVLSEPRAAVLRDAMVAFIVGGSIRRRQAQAIRGKSPKYSFLFHTESARTSHEWQERVAIAIRDSLVAEARDDTPRFNELIFRAYSDLSRSVGLEGGQIPALEDVKAEVRTVLLTGQLMITKVNSDKDVDELLDVNGQLKLRTPFNMFIGGQILDRGLTISNLIGFYYGRNPRRFQQDTVLQHSRMYGARSLADLAVTRFYAPQHVYQVMRNIHAFDAALRDAFISGAHDRGVYFLQKDAQNRMIPCSPNKIMFSDLLSIRPGRRLLPVGFQTVAKSSGAKALALLDRQIAAVVGKRFGEPVLISVEKANVLLELAYENLEFADLAADERRAHLAALEHLSRSSNDSAVKGNVWLLAEVDRNVARYREEGRFSDAPDTKQQADLARKKALDVPVLMLLRQNGEEEKGWRGLPFWWPVIVTPQNAVTSIFSSDTPANLG